MLNLISDPTVFESMKICGILRNKLIISNAQCSLYPSYIVPSGTVSLTIKWRVACWLKLEND